MTKLLFLIGIGFHLGQRRELDKRPEELCRHPIRSDPPLLITLPWLHLIQSKSQSPHHAQRGPTQSAPLPVGPSPPSVLLTCPVPGTWASFVLHRHPGMCLPQGPCTGSSCYQESSSLIPASSLTSYKSLFICYLLREVLISLFCFSLYHLTNLSLTYSIVHLPH